jgi:hypothetical protein
MNRQARLEGSKQWTDYGNVTFFEAIKTHAILTSQRNSLCPAKWVVEVRCESEPESIRLKFKRRFTQKF